MRVLSMIVLMTVFGASVACPARRNRKIGAGATVTIPTGKSEVARPSFSLAGRPVSTRLTHSAAAQRMRTRAITIALFGTAIKHCS